MVSLRLSTASQSLCDACEQSFELQAIFATGFLQAFLLAHAVGQFILSPLLLWRGFFSALLSNALYAAALGYYHYLNFLGYSSMPFLDHTEVCSCHQVAHQPAHY
jgi:UNC-50 family